MKNKKQAKMEKINQQQIEKTDKKQKMKIIRRMEKLWLSRPTVMSVTFDLPECKELQNLKTNEIQAITRWKKRPKRCKCGQN